MVVDMEGVAVAIMQVGRRAGDNTNIEGVYGQVYEALT